MTIQLETYVYVRVLKLKKREKENRVKNRRKGLSPPSTRPRFRKERQRRKSVFIRLL